MNGTLATISLEAEKPTSEIWGVFDTEDNSAELLAKNKSGFDKRVTQIAALTSDNRTFYSRGNVGQFKGWLQSLGKCIFWAHNLQYDLGNIFGSELDALDIRCMLGGRMITVVWGQVTFHDSMNIWPMSLKKIGDAFALQKGMLNARSKAYIMRDCEILLRAMSHTYQFAADRDCGMHATLGGLAVDLWQTWGGENWTCTDKFARNALYGGRVELFNRGGTGNILYCDINSLYPYIMTRTFPGPVSATDEVSHYGVFDVTIRIPEQPLCPLPMRRADGSIYYPYGTMRGTWCGCELENAIDNHDCEIVEFHRGYASESGEQYYSRYVALLYEMRLQAQTESEKLFYKLLMNNLYGQLGIRGTITRSIALEHALNKDGPIYGNKRLCDLEIPLPRHVNYLHAAWTTALARAHLLAFLRKVPVKNLIYCDTDSIIFWHDPKTIMPFVCNKALGQMKLENQAQACFTFAPKMYRFGEEFKAKGVPRHKAKDFIQLGYADYEAPFRFRESVAMYDRANSKPLSVWRKVKKVAFICYDKKRQLPDGRYVPIKHQER